MASFQLFLLRHYSSYPVTIHDKGEQRNPFHFT